MEIPLVEFDIHGNKEVNYIRRERHYLRDKTLLYVVPNGSPFFHKDVVVYNQAGGIIRSGYTTEEEIPALTEVLGIKAFCFIKLTQSIVNQNEYIEITYRSVGMSYVPRSNLEEWITAMQNGKTPIDFERVFGVPATVPSSYHAHDGKTEIADWDEFIIFFKLLKGLFSKVVPGDVTAGRNAATEAFRQLAEFKNTQLARIMAHDKHYFNPHVITKAMLDLGNVANYRTATAAQELEGTSSTVYSTLKGVRTTVKSNLPDTSEAMKAGILPISRYGGNSFIPPNISGSFEGMGVIDDVRAWCVERSGELVTLSNYYDGRTYGLYYCLCENYKTNNAVLNFTGYKYEPASLTSRGFTPEHIVAGSDENVIMVSNASGSRYYIAASNFTFDATKHVYVECNMTNVTSIVGTALKPYVGGTHVTPTAKVHKAGNKVFLTIWNGGGYYEEMFVFFVSYQDIVNGVDVTWTHLKLTYQDFWGEQYTNVNSFKPSKATFNTNNQATRSGRANFINGTYLTIHTSPRYGVTDLFEIAGNANQIGFNILKRVFYSTDLPTRSVQIDDAYEIQYRLNHNTGVMTLLRKSPVLNIDLTTWSNTNLNTTDYNPRFLRQIDSGQGTTTHDGYFLTIEASSHYVYPGVFFVTKLPGINSLTQMRNNLLRNFVQTASLSSVNFVRYAKALIHNNLQEYAGAFTDGELFTAQLNEDYGRKMFFKRQTANYAVRATLTNLKKSPVHSKPLSNNTYHTNLERMQPVISVTGDTASFGSVGNRSNASLSGAVWYSKSPDDYLPRQTPLRKNGTGAVLTFPRTVTKTYNELTKTCTFTPTSYFALSTAVFNTIKNYVTTSNQARGWAFTLNYLTPVNITALPDVDLIVICLYSYENATVLRNRFIVGRPTIVRRTGDQSDVYDITALNGVSVSNNNVTSLYSTTDTDNLAPSKLDGHPGSPSMSVYKDGDILKMSIASGLMVETTSFIQRMTAYLEFNYVTNSFGNWANGQFSYSIPENIKAIPQIGMSDFSLANTGYNDSTRANLRYVYTSGDDTGQASLMVRKTMADNSVRYYTLASMFLEQGWLIYLPSDTPLLINGTQYVLDGGVIDLRDVATDPANKTFYLYATIENSKPTYIITQTKLRKSSKLLPVAVITTGTNQIVTIDRSRPLFIGDYMVGYNREGGIIPVSSGLPQDEGRFEFLTQSELLP